MLRKSRLFIVVALILCTSRPTLATHSECHQKFDCWVFTGKTVIAGEEFQEAVNLFVYGSVPCGGFIAYVYPSWGGIDSGTYEEFSPGIDDYTSYVNYIDAPTTSGEYSYEIQCVKDLCTGTVCTSTFDVDVTVIDPEDDLEIDDHTFGSSATVGVESCGEVRIHNNSSFTYEINKVDLDDTGAVNPEWTEDDYNPDFTLTPSDEDWTGPYCFTANSVGTFTITAEVLLAVNNEWYQISGSIPITVQAASDPCATVSCSDYCSGSTRVYGRTCVNGACTTGNTQNCAYGCTGSGVCNQDPCAGVTCFDYCNGNNRVYGRTCSGGACTAGNTQNCDNLDTLGPVEPYCQDGDVYSHRWQNNFGCVGGQCLNLGGTWTNITLVQDCGALGCSEEGGAHCVVDLCASLLECPDLCGWGNIRYWGGVPTLVNGNCECEYIETDCDVMDTEPVTVYYCTGIERRAYDSFTNYSCNLDSATCVGAPAFENDRLIATCPYGCTTTGCLTCEPNWECTEWSPCNGPAQSTRLCWDNNGCGTDEGRPDEVEICPCELEEVAWSTDSAVDGDTVQLYINTRGACAGQCLPYELLEEDWPEDADIDFWLFRDDIERTGSYCLEFDDGMIVDWLAKFVPQNWDGFNEFRMRVYLGDNYTAYEETDIITVEPHRDDLGPLQPILVENTFSPISPSDEDCFLNAEVAITSACIPWWNESGEYAEVEAEELLETVVEIVVGATVLEIAWNAACTLCAFPAVHVGAVSACAASGIGCVLIPLDVAVCGYACLEIIAAKVVKVARLFWHSFLSDWLTRFIDELGAGAWEVVRAQADETGAYKLLRNEEGETWDLWAFVDPNNPSNVRRHGVKNSIRHYACDPGGYCGGGKFLEYVGKPENIRSDGVPLFHYAKPTFTPGPDGEFALLGNLFRRDGASLTSTWPEVWQQSMQDIPGITDYRDALKQVQFVKVAVKNGVPQPDTLALTSPESLSGGTGVMQFALRANIEHFGAQAKHMILHRAVPHEIGHNTFFNQVKRMTYKIFPIPSLGRWNEWPTEFFNDAFTLQRLTGQLKDDFRGATREWMENSYKKIVTVQVNGMPVEMTRGQTFVRDFVKAIEDNQFTNPPPAVWRLASFRAYAEEFGMTELLMLMDADMTAALAQNANDLGPIAWFVLTDKTAQLHTDAATYTAHLLDEAATEEFDSVVVWYEMVDGSLFPSAADVIGAVGDDIAPLNRPVFPLPEAGEQPDDATVPEEAGGCECVVAGHEHCGSEWPALLLAACGVFGRRRSRQNRV